MEHAVQLAHVRLRRLEHHVPVRLDDEHHAVAGLQAEPLPNVLGIVI